MYSDTKQFTKAHTKCQNLGGTLAILTKAQTADVAALLDEIGHNGAMIGLKREPGCSNVFKWVNGAKLTYTAWGTGSPKDAHLNSDGDCVADFPLVVLRPNATWWNGGAYSMPYICRLPADCNATCQGWF